MLVYDRKTQLIINMNQVSWVQGSYDPIGKNFLIEFSSSSENCRCVFENEEDVRKNLENLFKVWHQDIHSFHIQRTISHG